MFSIGKEWKLCENTFCGYIFKIFAVVLNKKGISDRDLNLLLV